MTVRELIALLEQYDGEMKVCTNQDEGPMAVEGVWEYEGELIIE
jgi:hypothetical protein